MLQEAIHCSFTKFCIYRFSVWYEYFVHYALKFEKNYQHDLDAGPMEFQFLRPRECLTNPFRTLSLCFGVICKTSGLISCNNFVKKIFVIGHRDSVLARCDSIFPLLRCQEVRNKTCKQLSLSQILFQNPKVIFDQISKQQQRLPQFESTLDGHLSRHLLPAFNFEIENTT